jgi:hypothetical protein
MNAVQTTPAPHHSPGWMRVLHWTPRVLGILFVLFISLFAADVFGMGLDFWGTMVGLTMHLIPSFALILVLVLAWRWPWVGTIAFAGFGIWYIITSWGEFDWTAPVLIGGVPIVVGLLFLADWWVRRTKA